MKNTFLPAALAGTLLLTACSDKPGKAGTTPATADAPAAPAASPAQESTAAVSIEPIIQGYLQLKNALADDKTGDAAAGGRAITAALGSTDQSGMSAAQKATYAAAAGNLSTHAERVNGLSGNIDMQRMHFEAMSRDMEKLVKTFRSEQPLYKDFCPMAFDGKGANWLSETEAIRNPYFGARMQHCGEVKAKL